MTEQPAPAASDLDSIHNRPELQARFRAVIAAVVADEDLAARHAGSVIVVKDREPASLGYFAKRYPGNTMSYWDMNTHVKASFIDPCGCACLSILVSKTAFLAVEDHLAHPRAA